MKLAVVGLLASLVASAYASHRAPPRPAAMHAHAVGPNARRFAAGLPPLAPLRGKRELRGQSALDSLDMRQASPSFALNSLSCAPPHSVPPPEWAVRRPAYAHADPVNLTHLCHARGMLERDLY